MVRQLVWGKALGVQVSKEQVTFLDSLLAKLLVSFDRLLVVSLHEGLNFLGWTGLDEVSLPIMPRIHLYLQIILHKLILKRLCHSETVGICEELLNNSWHLVFEQFKLNLLRRLTGIRKVNVELNNGVLLVLDLDWSVGVLD